MLPPILVELKANAGEFMTKMGEARHEVQKLETESAGHVSKFAAVGKAALLGFGGAALAVGVIAVKAAMEGQVAHAALTQAIKNAGGSMEHLEPRVSALSDKFAKFGFTNDEVEAGLATMTTSLHNPEKAMGAMGLAADLARFKHIDLAAASLAVAKAMEGQLRPLKALGIDLPVSSAGAAKLATANDNLAIATQKATTFLKIHPDAVNASSKSHGVYMQMLDKVDSAQARVTAATGAATAITKGLSDAVGGQASAAAETYAGRLAAAHAQVENLAEKLGNHLLPIIGSAIDKTTALISVTEHHTTAAKVVAGVIGGVLAIAIAAYIAGIIASTVATVAHTVAQVAHTVAVLAGSVVMAARITLIYATVAAENIASLASKAWTAAQWLLNAALTANPIGLVIVALVALGVGLTLAWQHSTTFRNVVTAVWDAVRNAVSTAVAFIKSHLLLFAAALGPVGVAAALLLTHWHAAWSGISAAVSGAWSVISAIVHAIESAISAVAGSVSGLMSTISSVASAASKVASIGSTVGSVASKLVPHFAGGVQNFGGGLALVGERGPELVELPRGSNVYPNGTGPASGSSGAITVEAGAFQVIVQGGDPTVVQAAVDRAFDQLVQQLRSGRR